MNLLFATAELAPLAKVGGLAEAASGLVKALRAEHSDIDLHLVMPDYGDVELTDESHDGLAVPHWVGGAGIRTGTHPEIGQVTLVNAPGMHKPHPYIDDNGQGWPDNDHRFFAFSAAVASIADQTQPDVLHLNDWHSAAAVGFLQTRIPAVLTIHTLGYQGACAPEWMGHIRNDAWRFAWNGATNPMAGAIDLADRVIAVSPNYAREIVQDGSGFGLHERLAGLGDRLIGIRNGIDKTVWDPATDKLIPANFSKPGDDGREQCRKELRTQADWPQDSLPIAAAVTRLVDQKGIDILMDAARFFPKIGCRLVVLGSGDRNLSEGLRWIADNNGDYVRFVDGYDTELAHLLFAGSDLYLMPSRFEPCGLGQMQAMAYGSIPVVTAVGGLVDTVIDVTENPKQGTGFLADTVDAAALVDAMHRAVKGVSNKRRREAMQNRGMSTDWSWSDPAQQHVDIYNEIAGT